MKKLILVTLLLSGCSLTPNVTLEVACNEMRGRVGNSCKITVPSNADVVVDGESIEIIYQGE